MKDKDEDDGHNERKPKPQIMVAFTGATASFIARNFAQPFDVIKTRFQLQVEPIGGTSKYTSIPQAFRMIYHEEGIKAFWKGNVPALGISVLYGFCQFITFEHVSQWSKGRYVERNFPNLNTFLCGGCSGILATGVVQPLDVTKTRIISQDKAKGYRNMVEAIRTIFVTDGIRGLYRGATAAFVEIVPYNGLNFMFYRYFSSLIMPIFGTDKRHYLPLWLLMSMGAASATLAKSITYPLDTMKKRFHIQGFEEHRKSFGEFAYCNSYYTCIRDIIRKEGFFSMYKGFGPTVCKSAVTIAIQFSLYDIFNEMLKATTDN